jgi:predicted DNA-binding transcriptional regulator AlpA
LEPLLEPPVVSDQLKIPVATLRRWRYEGIGPVSFRAGRHVRYRQSDIDDWIEAQIQKST